MASELLQQVRVIDPVAETDRVADVLIEAGIIRAIANRILDYPSGTTLRDSHGLVLGAGLIDLYSHSSEPGFEARETLDSLRQSAAAGGFTRVTILPDTLPAIDHPANVEWFQAKKTASRSPMPQLHYWAALTMGTQGQQMTEVAELAMAGIAGFADGKPLNNLLLVQRLLDYLQPLDQPIALWAWDTNLASNGVMREGLTSIQSGLPGIPAIAETSALAALLECIEITGTPVHLMRISTARSVELIRTAKARGMPITASTTWMHLLLNSESVSSYDPNLRLNPPLGNPTDQIALLQGMQAGVLDAIAIDHTPYTYEEKTVAFSEAPCGAIGLELALPLLWHQLVETGNWSALELWRCLSSNPARCLNQSISAIAPGQPAELTLFDPKGNWIAEPHALKSRSANTPWLGQTIPGRVLNVWC
jgi:dihydroorotase